MRLIWEVLRYFLHLGQQKKPIHWNYEFRGKFQHCTTVMTCKITTSSKHSFDFLHKSENFFSQDWDWELINCFWNRSLIFTLTRCGRVTYICTSKLTIIGSGNGLSPDRRQAIIWTNAGIVNWTLRNKLQWNLNGNSNIFIHENAFESVVC